jgi:hypothetical protein
MKFEAAVGDMAQLATILAFRASRTLIMISKYSWRRQTFDILDGTIERKKLRHSTKSGTGTRPNDNAWKEVVEIQERLVILAVIEVYDVS